MSFSVITVEKDPKSGWGAALIKWGTDGQTSKDPVNRVAPGTPGTGLNPFIFLRIAFY